LKTNGSYTPWNYAAGNYYGNQAFVHTSEGGIYQIRVIASAESGSDERYYVWQEDEDTEIGLNKKGNLKAFGVCDEQWQIELRNCAKSYLGSTAYAKDEYLPAQYGYPEYPKGDVSFKCNIFVAHMCAMRNIVVPGIRGIFRNYPPLANDWANPLCVIDYWVIEDNFSQPGFVVANFGKNMGHVGIMDFDGCAISAGGLNVNRRFKTWVKRTVKRKYLRR
jgi:hypothetical protein